MPSTPLALSESIDPHALRAVVYELLVLVAMLVVLGLAMLLPGTDRALPDTSVTIRVLVTSIGTIAVVVWFAHAAPQVEALAVAGLDGPVGVVADAGRVASAVVVFLGVLVAYRGLAGLVVPVLARNGAAWAYDIGFLLVALGPIVVVTHRLARNIDVLADQLAGAVTERRDGPVGADRDPDHP